MNFRPDSESKVSSIRSNSRSYRELQLEMIDLEPEFFEKATLLSRHFSNEAEQWQAYLNTLALLALEKWLSDRQLTLSYQTYSLLRTQVLNLDAVSPLNVEPFKLCLIARENIGDQTIEIPQKMIDEPEFSAHFYTLIQVFLEEKQAVLIGFIRYDQLNQQSLKQTKTGNYELYLSEFNPEPSHLGLNLKYLDSTAIELPKNGLSKPSFQQLTQWLEHLYTADWQPVEQLLANRPPLVPFASAINFRTRNLSSQKTIEKSLKTLQMSGALGHQKPGDLSQTELSDVLVELLETTNNEETRWQAAELLWEVNPNHPAVGVRRAIDLGMQLLGVPVALMVALLPKPDQRIAILLRVYPLQGFLPDHLKLIGLDELGQSLFEVRARERDDYIQFKFTADPGDQFSVQIVLNDANVTEYFIV
ncbi:MAG: DUF1822 family protein [Limnoraphis robusta]|uniref:DUF1822 family protein n=1 Tax=Limnoraphis robusta TaxID=1118279 RepID=UPI00069DBCB9|nr:DUF1822 family protein [Limnoraphis robusta]MEA5537553.1 DUF1822 family protein [Limnoraphis robusta Tam1]